MPLPFYPVDLFADPLYNTYMTEDNRQDLVAKVLRNGYCPGRHCGGENIAEDDHTCPYAEDINNDSESLCNCCNICAYECAMYI